MARLSMAAGAGAVVFGCLVAMLGPQSAGATSVSAVADPASDTGSCDDFYTAGWCVLGPDDIGEIYLPGGETTAVLLGGSGGSTVSGR